MSIRIVQLGVTPRLPDEGARLGTVRRPPRGIRKEDYARLGYYDSWLPLLALIRFLIGLNSAGLSVIVESWLNALVANSLRGRVLAWRGPAPDGAGGEAFLVVPPNASAANS